MRIAVCLDDGGGMLFGGRRQSRDRVLLADVFADAAAHGGRLLINEFSKKLLDSEGVGYYLCDDMLALAEDTDTCFVENLRLCDHIDRISEIIIYRWNRKYPSDFLLDIDPEALGFSKTSSAEFVGSSHDKITKEIFVK